MKLSTDTLSVLKNFASISDGIMFRKGNVLRTCDAQKQVLAETTITETIDEDFGIYDLNKFLAVLGLHQDNSQLQIDTATKSAVINDNTGRSKITYRICDATMIKNASDKSVKMPDAEVTFTLKQADLEFILRSSSVLATPHISVTSDGSKIFVSALDDKNTSTHSNQLDVGAGNGKKYKMLFKTENLKMIPGEYEVSISFKGIAHFKNTTKPLQYWVATELGSTSEG
jgi:hypothetical protein